MEGVIVYNYLGYVLISSFWFDDLGLNLIDIKCIHAGGHTELISGVVSRGLIHDVTDLGRYAVLTILGTLRKVIYSTKVGPIVNQLQLVPDGIYDLVGRPP